MPLNIALKTVLMQRTMSQFELAQRAKIHDSRLSKIINGWIEPNDNEKAAIAKVLRTPIDQLFASTDSERASS